jgi:beta-ribofuranosylaminobenzene 5'-phosphate synthase
MRRVTVTAPSRLHFGLWSLENPSGRQFGGIGAMLEEPGLGLQLEPALELRATGPLADRAIAFARRWAEFHALAPPRCQIEVRSAPPDHVGLGTGTQLALAVAAGLDALHDRPAAAPWELAASVGRGLRSAVGTYGFFFGGLIVEQGKLPDEILAPIDCRLDLPDPWMFVLIRPRGISGLEGDDEAQAIQQLPAVPKDVTNQLTALVRERLVPAAALGDFATFAAGLFAYGHLAGQCFAARQGGPYNGRTLTEIVTRIRSLGFPGVGQSSWGPTIFAAVESVQQAEQLAVELRRTAAESELEIVLARPCRHGARVEIDELDPLGSAEFWSAALGEQRGGL